MSSSTTQKHQTGKGGKQPASKQQGRSDKPKRPPPSPEQKTKKHFKSLLAQVEGGHFANAIKTCDKIIRLAPSPDSVPEALQTKVVCLLHLEKYDDALSLLDSLSSSTQSNTEKDAGGIERAYALYRLGKEPSVILPLLNLRERPNLGRGAVHLKAQLCYRNGMFEEAVNLYNELLDSCDINSEEYKDVENNLLAAQQRLEFETTGFKAPLHTIDAARLEELSPPTDIPPSVPADRIPASVTVPSNPPPGKAKQPKSKPQSKSKTAGGPDPERWIKKSERESYRPSRRDRGAQGTTQGLRSK